MQEDFLERLHDVFGASEVPGLPELNVDDDLQLERAADLLVRRFQATSDIAAYELLVDLAGRRLSRLAAQIARDIGLAEDPDELVVAFYEALFVDVAPLRDDAPGFLTRADSSMRSQAETRVRDIALSRVSDPTGPVRWDADGKPQLLDGPAEIHARATHICLHRLDLPHRRVLRASQMDGLGNEEVAKELSIPVADVESLLLEAMERLDQAIEKELEGGSP